MMRTVPFKQVFNKVARWHGFNPNKDIEPDARDAISERINDRVSEICGGYPWPEWNVTEQRAYRQVWNAEHQYSRASTGGAPDEVFFKQDSFYYRVRADAANDPPVGTLPTDTNFWVALTIDQVGTYIAYDQICRRAIGNVLGIYSKNPSGCGCNGNGSSGKLKFHVSHNGVEICHPSASTVFVSFQQPVPKYTMVPYADGKTYPKADVVFDPVTGECFQALVATDNPPNTTDWSRIPFLDKWEKYVTNGAYADGLFESDRTGNTDVAARQILRAEAKLSADDALQRELDLLNSQGNTLKWVTCKRGEYWCESLPWSGGVVSEISDACEAGWVFPDILPPIVPPGTFQCPTPETCPEVAYLGEPNNFRNVNSIPGIRLETREITEDYELTVIDFEIPVNASTGPVTIFLPLALGSGQFYHVKKTDDSDNPVFVVAVVGDNIDGEPLVVLAAQYNDVALIDAELGYWDRFRSSLDSITPPLDLSDFARKSLFNQFTELNQFTGVQFRCITVTEDYEPTTLDFTMLANAAGGPIAFNLPPATGSGQLYHFKKIDATAEVVTMNANGTDLIDGSISVNFTDQWGSALLQDAAPGYWDNIGAVVDDGGGGITPFPTRPTTLNEVIAAGVAIGLWP